MRNPPYVSLSLQKIVNTLKENKFKCFLVGGAIRSHLLSRVSKDIDLATDATPEQMMILFKRVIPTGIEHGTVTVLMDNEVFEITTFRSEGKYSDSRRPDKIIFISSIEEDLKRRDFTINSIAFDLVNRVYFDPNKGKKDLKRKTIKAIGNAEERFTEDALRPLRAIRFVGQLGFDIDDKTFKAMKKCAKLSTGISKERITDEIIKTFASSNIKKALTALLDSTLLFKIYADFLKVDKKKITLAMETCYNIRPSYVELRFAGFFLVLDSNSKVASNKFIDIAKFYRLPNNFIKKTSHFILYHNFDYKVSYSDSDIRRLVKKLELENLPYFFELWVALALASKSCNNKFISKLDNLSNRIDNLRDSMVLDLKDLAIKGDDLVKLNIKGKDIGLYLTRLLDLVLDDVACNREDFLLGKVKEWVIEDRYEDNKDKEGK